MASFFAVFVVSMLWWVAKMLVVDESGEDCAHPHAHKEAISKSCLCGVVFMLCCGGLVSRVLCDDALHFNIGKFAE